jgi:hypothetical protein
VKKKTHVDNYSKDEMLPLETKQSGGKLLPHSGQLLKKDFAPWSK